MFVGREEELKMIQSKLNTMTPESIVVYGRRRVGKSRLINEALSNIDGMIISYESYESSYMDNIEALTKEICEATHNKYLKFDNIEDIILFLAEEGKKHKTVLFIDEYPFMREGKKTDSYIKNALDKIDLHYEGSDFKLILCGSSIQIMSALDDRDMPLHGRFSVNINLGQLDYYTSSLLFEELSDEDKVLYY